MSGAVLTREAVSRCFLDQFTALTGVPTALFTLQAHEADGIESCVAAQHADGYCATVRALLGGGGACDLDQRQRLQLAGIEGTPRLSLCHAGLFTYLVPIAIETRPRCVLAFGRMLVQDDALRAQAVGRQDRFLEEHTVPRHDCNRLREALLSSPSLPLQTVERLAEAARLTGPGLASLFREEDLVQAVIDNIGHEVQTRLQAVIARAENLRDTLRETTRVQLAAELDELLNSTLSAATVVQNLGDYLSEYRFRPTPLRELVESSRRLYLVEASHRGIDIEVGLPGESGAGVVLEISRAHVQHVIDNLLSNAVKYSYHAVPGGRRVVRVSGTSAGLYYRLVFENYGVGILPGEIKKGLIFQDGYQGALTKGEFRPGAGKGLSLVKRVVERHHGWIEVESLRQSETEPHKGQPHLNRFVIYLPYRQSSQGGPGA